MAHPIVALQGALLTALRADPALVALVGENGVFDAPPKGRVAPYVAIVRHDCLPRDGDAAPGYEHRVLLQAWHGEASRKAVLEIEGRVVAAALALGAAEGLVITHRQHERTETSIDGKTGQARAVIALRFFSEPAE